MTNNRHQIYFANFSQNPSSFGYIIHITFLNIVLTFSYQRHLGKQRKPFSILETTKTSQIVKTIFFNTRVSLERENVASIVNNSQEKVLYSLLHGDENTNEYHGSIK